jgi:regulator of protease activity HflC (stomatin/prohibitin superfamily)
MIFFSVIKQYERAVVFKLGKVTGAARGPGLIFIVPGAQRVHPATSDQPKGSTNGELVAHGRHQPD